METGIQQINSFQLLEYVNNFYNNAWNRLIVAVTISLFVIGVIMPLLIQWYQRKFFRLEENKIKEGIKTDLLKEVKNNFEEEKKNLGALFKGYQKNLDIEFAVKDAHIFHVQASQNLVNKAYKDATISILYAITSYLEGKDSNNFRRALTLLNGSCLPYINKKDLDDIKVEGCDVDKTIEDIEKKFSDGRYYDLLVEIKRAVKTARNR